MLINGSDGEIVIVPFLKDWNIIELKAVWSVSTQLHSVLKIKKITFLKEIFRRACEEQELRKLWPMSGGTLRTLFLDTSSSRTDISVNPVQLLTFCFFHFCTKVQLNSKQLFLLCVLFRLFKYYSIIFLLEDYST